MPWPGHNTDAVMLIAHFAAECKCRMHRARRREDRRMCDDAQEATENKVRHAVGLVTVDDGLHPFPQSLMTWRVGSMRIHEDVNVHQDHRLRSIKSRIDAVSSRSTPFLGPFPPTVVSRTAFRAFGRLCSRLWRNASSITAVIVFPVLAATSLTRFMR